MDNKDIKMLKLLFDKASSDGERINIINMLNKKYNNDVISNIINQSKSQFFDDNIIINRLMMENCELKIDNEKLNADLYYAKFCATFWFLMMIIIGVAFIIF